MNNVLVNVFKLVFAVLLLPVGWACSWVFYRHITGFPGAYGEFFLWGMFGFLLLFLFFYQFWGVYELGQKINEGIFQFVSPVNRVIAHVVPFYAAVILLLFYVVTNFLGVNDYDHYFMFFSGFTLTMHILLTSQDLQMQEKAFIKPNYLFMMVVVLIFSVFVTVLFFDLAFQEFTFPKFFQLMARDAWDVYSFVWDQILSVK